MLPIVQTRQLSANKRTLLQLTTAFAIVCVMWKDIITSLMKSGMTQHQIAEAAGISQTHVSDLMNEKRGKRLSFQIGQRLAALHSERCPTENVSSSAG